MSSSDPLMVAALDFGTTYSGYAFSMKHEFKVDPMKIHANQAWNSGGRGLLSMKTPTCLLLDADKKFVAFGYDAENKYADIVLDEKQDEYLYFHRFKMNLHNNKNIRSEMVLEDIRGKVVPALYVFSLSIKALVDHLMQLLEQRGTGLKMTEIRWVLTVPAIWTDAAKQFMRKSAEQAGIPGDNLLLALEPEAASIFCQYLPTEKLLGTEKGFTILEPGTQYMVVDLGGGTADITVHEKTTGGHLKELFRATGSDCGGTSVDGKFFQMLVKIFRGPIMKTLKEEEPGAYLDLFREFEAVKRLIEPTKSDKVNVTIPYVSLDSNCVKFLGENLPRVLMSSTNAKEISLRGDKIRFDAELMKSLFDVTIGNIVELMREVLTGKAVKNVNIILLVGGFAECRLVQEAIKSEFKNKRLIIPEEPMLAVLKGAVLFGHQPDYIQSRIMRFTYGIRTTHAFNHEKHDKRYLKLYDGKERCDNIFAIFVQKNQSVLAGMKVTREFFTVKKNQKDVSIPVFLSTSENPIYTEEDGCTQLYELILVFPNPCENNRFVDVVFIFGNTEIKIKATDRTSGKQISAQINIM